MADFWSQFQTYAPIVGAGATAAGQTLSGTNPQAAQQFIQQYGPSAYPNAAQIGAGAQQVGSMMTPRTGPAVNQNMQQGQATLLSGAPVGSTVYNPSTGQTVGSGTTAPTDPRMQTAAPTGGGSADYQSEFMQAVQALGIQPQQLRGNPALMDKVSNYLTQKYPGQQWANGGQKAGDWFSVNGQGFDVLPAGDKNFQWLSDPAGSQVAGGQQGGYWTGDVSGGGQYPLASAGGPGLAEPWTTPFKAPDNLTEQNDPGFQARMKMGTDAIQRSAAARGTLLTGGLLKGLDRYAQDYASNEYSNVYNRALGQYQMAYDIFNNNGNTLFNRLGQLGSIGENAAAGVGNSQIGVGDARAAGSINQGNIWGNVASGVGGTIQNIYNNQAFQQKPPQTSGSSYTPVYG